MSRPISELPTFINGLFTDTRDVLFETAMRIRERMAVVGKPVQYPVQWDSAKQQRAYFATNGFGKGIPYKRTGQYALSWQVERVPLGSHLKNASPAGAVGGMVKGSQWQSRIHRNRWPYLLAVVFEEIAKIPDALSNRFKVAGK